MLRWIVGSSVRFRVLMVGIAAAIAVFGVAQVRHAPVDVLPEFSPPYVEIQTEALGLSANEVEELITAPMEADLLNGVEGVDVIRSKSVPGMSSIVLVFHRGTDIFKARQLVQERLNQAHALPQVSAPPQMLQPLSSSSRVLVIGLSAKNLSLIQQGVLARWTIRPRLMGVPGVANVEIWGQRDRQLQVLVDPQRLRAKHVSLEQIVETAGNAQFVSPLTFLEGSTPGTGGFFDTPSQRLGIRHVFPTARPAELAKVSVEDAPKLRLGDVATVVEDHQPLIGDAVGPQGARLFVVVEKLPGANTLELTHGVEDALDEVRPGLAGMQADTSVYRPASFIEEATGNIALALIAGGILLALAIAALTFDWRRTVIALCAVAASVVTAVLALDALGAGFNALVVAGLVVAAAVVVDDALLASGNYIQRMPPPDKRDGFRARTRVLVDATLEVRRPLVYATLIVLLATLPLFFLDGVPSHMFSALARAYVLAVLASTLVALALTPALCSLLLARTDEAPREAPGLAAAVRRGHERALARVTPRIGAAAAALLAVAAVAAAFGLHRSDQPSLLPTFKDRTLLVNWSAPPGTSRAEMDRIMARANADMRALPGVGDVGTHIGRAVTGDQVANVNNAETWVKVARSADYARAVHALQAVINGYAGLRHQLTTYSKERVRQIGLMEDGRDDNHDGREDSVVTSADENGGARRDIVVRIYGYDLATLRRKAADAKRLLASVDGVRRPTVERPPMQPTIQVEVDLARAERYGLKPGDVRRAASALVSGIVVGNLFEQQKVFDVVVWGTAATRNSLTSIRKLLIDTPDGGHVPLADVADVRVTPTPAVIRRDSVQRRLDVSADVRGRSLGAVERDVRARLAHLAFPLEYHAELLAPAAERRAAGFRVISIALAAAVGIVLLLQAAFRSWRVAALVFLTLPLALSGGVVALWIAGGTLSLGAAAGFLAVLGFAAHNALLCGPFNARERVVPVLTTAVATALAVLPCLVLGDIAGLELLEPMAVVVLGGLVTTTFVALLIAPLVAPPTDPQRTATDVVAPPPGVGKPEPAAA